MLAVMIPSTTKNESNSSLLSRNFKRQWSSLQTMPNQRNHPKKSLIISSVEPDQRSQVPQNLHPHEFLVEKLQTKGVHVKACQFEDIENFFSHPTQEDIDAYNSTIIEAVRTSNIQFLRNYHKEGKHLKCSNRFGESLLHLAARKERVDVVDFLLNEANLSPAVCDDYGRTPLHDACWSSVPNFALVDLIVQKCPDLLYIKDKRGHTPLFYARQNHWKDWIRHLEQQLDKLVPKTPALKMLLPSPVSSESKGCN
jgi:hypothetical protein